MKYWISLISLTLAGHYANSQTLKKGCLVDYYLDVPIIGARISVYDKSIEVISDSLGQFRIMLAEEDFFLISAKGYKKLKVKAPENSNFIIHIESLIPPPEELRFYSVVDEQADLKEDLDLLEYILKYFRYWDRVKLEGISGIVQFDMKIDELGKVTEVKIVKGLAKYIDDELLRIVKQSEWIPAKVQGKKVKTRFAVSVPF